MCCVRCMPVTVCICVVSAAQQQKSLTAQVGLPMPCAVVLQHLGAALHNCLFELHSEKLAWCAGSVSSFPPAPQTAKCIPGGLLSGMPNITVSLEQLQSFVQSRMSSSFESVRPSNCRNLYQAGVMCTACIAPRLQKAHKTKLPLHQHVSCTHSKCFSVVVRLILQSYASE